MKLSSLSYDVWKSKYQCGDEKNYEDSVNRWVDTIKKSDKKYGFKETDDYYDSLKNELNSGNIIYGGSILYGLGREGIRTSLSNCYFLNIQNDSLESIFETSKNMAKTFAWRGGVGIDISTLRPKEALTKNAAHKSTGAVSFMPMFSRVTQTIGQNGRRGALMISIEDTHPDVLDFIKSKTEIYPNEIEKANISVKISNKTMESYKNNEEIELYFKSVNETITKKIKAKDLIKMIALHSWKYADPGIIYWDHVIDNSPSSVFDELKPMGTNPCGEIPMSHGEACLLGHLNLSNFIDESGNIMKGEMRTSLNLLARSLDTVLQINSELHPLEIQKEKALLGRRMGIGFTGLGDALAKMKTIYGSNDSIEKIEDILSWFNYCLYSTSFEMAKERGVAPIFQKHPEKLNEYLNSNFFMNSKLFDYMNKNDVIKVGGFRNIQLSTVAPTGSTSLLLGVTSGIEPLFSAFHIRKVEMGETKKPKLYPIIHDQLRKIMNEEELNELNNFLENGFEDLAYDYMNKISKKYYYISSHEINYENRIKVQGVIQKYIDNSISSTINLSKEVEVKDIEKIYVLGWEHKLKGVTIYRDGSRSGILSNPEKKKQVFNIQEDKLNTKLYEQFEKSNGRIIKKDLTLPKIYPVIGRKVSGDGKKWFIDLAFADRMMTRPFAIFIWSNQPKNKLEVRDPYYIDSARTRIEEYAKEVGIDTDLIQENIEDYKGQDKITQIARAIGLLLRHNVSVDKVVELLGTPTVGTLMFQIKKVLSEYIQELSGEKCPECGKELMRLEGCLSCSCGFSKCG